MLHVQPQLLLPPPDEEEEKTEFTFAELSDRAQEKAREKWREHEPYDDWWDTTYEDAETIGNLLGIDFADKVVGKTKDGRAITETAIYFTGFWSQGDGACFEGRWERPTHDIAAKVREHAGTDEELHGIADSFAELAKRCERNPPVVRVKQRGNCCHEYSTSIDVEFDDPDRNELQEMVAAALDRAAGMDTFETDITEALRSFMRWIYSQLEAEHEDLTSDEVADEYLSDGKTFDEDGDEI